MRGYLDYTTSMKGEFHCFRHTLLAKFYTLSLNKFINLVQVRVPNFTSMLNVQDSAPCTLKIVHGFVDYPSPPLLPRTLQHSSHFLFCLSLCSNYSKSLFFFPHTILLWNKLPHHNIYINSPTVFKHVHTVTAGARVRARTYHNNWSEPHWCVVNGNSVTSADSLWLSM